jgi:putative acetyltransferase
MKYEFVPFVEGHAQQLADLTSAAIRGVGSKKYSPSQVDAWAARHPSAERFLERHAKGDMITVAVDETALAVAYSLVEPDGHFDMLYCHPDHTRRGIADRLLSHAEQTARLLGLKRLYTEASELARPTFERAGYTVIGRRDFTIEHDGKGVPIHNFGMEKLLD